MRNSKDFLVILSASETTSLLFMTSGHLTCYAFIYFSKCTLKELHMVQMYKVIKPICLRTVLIVWESFNKLRKTKQQNTKISTGMFGFCLYFIYNKSKAYIVTFPVPEGQEVMEKKHLQGWWQRQEHWGGRAFRECLVPLQYLPILFLREISGIINTAIDVWLWVWMISWFWLNPLLSGKNGKVISCCQRSIKHVDNA